MKKLLPITVRYGWLEHTASISIENKNDKTNFRVVISDMDIDINKDINKDIEFSEDKINSILYDILSEREDTVWEYWFTYRDCEA